MATADIPTTSTATPAPALWKPSHAGPKVHHLHKLEKKDSNSDLHSRLKSRKVLGVGETDDGDVHRSKLSQILGHSEQLQQRLPRGFRIWQVLIALHFGLLGCCAILFPSSTYVFQFGGSLCDALPYRLFGGALVSFSLILWTGAYSPTKEFTRWCLVASGTFIIFHLMLHVISALQNSITKTVCYKLILFGEILELLTTAGYYYKTGQRARSPRITRLSEDKGRSCEMYNEISSDLKKDQ